LATFFHFKITILRTILIVCFLLFTVHSFSQSNTWFFSSSYSIGKSFYFNKPSTKENHEFRHLKSRLIFEHGIRFKATKKINHCKGLNFNFGTSMGESIYNQPINLKGVNIPLNNGILYQYAYKRNFSSFFIGTGFEKSLYNNNITISAGIHLSHLIFHQKNQKYSSDFYLDPRFSSDLSWRFDILAEKSRIPFHFDIDVNIDFKINEKISFVFGAFMITPRGFNYNYIFEFQVKNSNGQWVNKRFENFPDGTKPRIHESVFNLNAGFKISL